jgi:perosamine synthetase
MGSLYTQLLEDVPEIQLPLEKTNYARNIYWVYGIVLRDSVLFDAREAMGRLGAAGIDTRPFFWPMNEQPVLRRMGLFANLPCPVASRIARRGFYIPSGLALSEQQIQSVAKAVREMLR